MPAPRCPWCTNPSFEEVAIPRWRSEEKERLRVPLCRNHLERPRKAGEHGRKTKG